MLSIWKPPRARGNSTAKAPQLQSRDRPRPLRLAREALESGGAAAIVLNAANEIAVEQFLAGSLRFAEIADLVRRALDDAKFDTPRSIGDVLEIDRVTRAQTRAMMKAGCA